MKPLRLLTAFSSCGILFSLVSTGARSAEPTAPDNTKWTSGSGDWTEAARWSDGVPNPFRRTEIHGVSTVLIPPGNYIAGDLEVGLESSDDAHVVLEGGQLLLLQDSLRVGELSGGHGEFILKDGALHCPVDVYSGAANSVPGRATKAAIRIEGGSFLARTLNVGSGWGADSLLAIEGSRPSAIHVLDYCYIQAFAATDGTPGVGTLSYTLDEHGVTPITIQSHRDGLRIIKDVTSHCRLQILLNAVPPRDDITLVSGHVPIKGTFDNLPEDSEIAAQYHGRTYRWALSYRGGTSGVDLVLNNHSDYAADAPVSRTRPTPVAPKPLWTKFQLYPLSAQTHGEPAFPRAEGFGAFTPGGSGGKHIYVENLNDSGTGSLRSAIETPGPRMILFHVGGIIALKSTLTIREPFLTIDGQNAPGPGIMLRNHGIEVQTHDAVLRYFRVRVGDEAIHLDSPKGLQDYAGGTGEHALYFIEGAKDCIADHLSLSWATTKILSVTKLSDRITIQWCILSEALNFAGHGYASIAGGNRVTWHHNLFAHNHSRNVRFGGLVDADFRNNVIYDWGDRISYGEFDKVNYIGNYAKPGPSTIQQPPQFHDGGAVVMPGSLFLTNNILEGYPKVNQDNWRGTGYFAERKTIAASEPFPAPAVATESPQVAYEHVLKEAGAILPRRDVVDERIVREVRQGTGHIIKWVKDAGGWPDFPTSSSPSGK